MIKSLRTKNLLSHRDTTLDFCDGVNVIVGQSQGGKSSCTSKPLGLITYNRPLGGGYLSNFCGGKDTTELHLTLDNGWVNLKKNIRTNKDGKKEVVPNGTTYELSNGNTFSDLSDQVSELINMTDLNIQDQSYKESGRPFLITDSPGEIARKINRITRLDKADEWVSELTRKVNDYSKNIERLKKEKGEKEGLLEKFSDIGRTEAIVAKVEKLEAELQNLEEELDDIKGIRADLSVIDKDIVRLEDVLKVADIVEEADGVQADIRSKQLMLRDIQNFLIINIQLLEMEDYLKDIDDDFFALEVVKNELDVLMEEHINIMLYLNACREAELCIVRKDETEGKFRELLKKTGKCYTCFTDLDDEKIEEILEGI